MKKNDKTSKQKILLLAGVSSIVLLAGCGITDMQNPFTDPRPPQAQPGARRPPILNVTTPLITPAAMPLAGPSNPGAPVLLGEESQSVSGPFVSSAKKDDMVRKAIPGNPNVSSVEPGSILAAPSPAPVAVAAPASSSAPPVYSGGYDAESEDYAKTEAQNKTETQEKPVQNKSIFEQIFGNKTYTPTEGSPPPWKLRESVAAEPQVDHHPVVETEEAMPEPEPNEMAPAQVEEMGQAPAKTPELSSVPPTPSAFEDMKASRHQNLQDMQSEYSKAQQEKSALVAEPSQQNTAPVAMPPAPSPKPAVAESQSSPPPTSNKPRRGIDIMTQEEWDAFQKEHQSKISTPPDNMSIPPSTPEGTDTNGTSGSISVPHSDLRPYDRPALVQLAANNMIMSDVVSEEPMLPKTEVIGEIKDSGTQNTSPTEDSSEAPKEKRKPFSSNVMYTPDDKQSTAATPVITAAAPIGQNSKPISAPVFGTVVNQPATSVADKKEQDSTASSTTTPDAVVPPADNTNASATPAAEAPAPEHQSLFSRWFGSAPAATVPDPSEPEATEPTPQMDAKATAPAPVPTPADVAPTAGTGTPLPAVSDLSVPVAQQDVKATLPSPQILEEVKMLPPSRYYARDRALQSGSAN